VSRWPTSLKKLRARFPWSDIVQVRVTLANGDSMSFDGKASPALKRAVAELVVDSGDEGATDGRR
jgi:hypothetical protein